MRMRVVKPGFFEDWELSRLPLGARLTFIGVWCMADRRGRLFDNPRNIASALFPHEDRTEDVTQWLAELAPNWITRYEVDGRKLMAVNKFEEHQHCNVREPESRLPAPPNQHVATTRAMHVQTARVDSTCSTVTVTGTGTGTTDRPFVKVRPFVKGTGPVENDFLELLMTWTEGRIKGRPGPNVVDALIQRFVDVDSFHTWLMSHRAQRRSIKSWGWFLTIAKNGY